MHCGPGDVRTALKKHRHLLALNDLELIRYLLYQRALKKLGKSWNQGDGAGKNFDFKQASLSQTPWKIQGLSAFHCFWRKRSKSELDVCMCCAI